MDRRGFIHGILATLAAVPTVAKAGIATFEKPQTPLHLVYNKRVCSRETALTQIGVEVAAIHEINGDVARTWQNNLSRLWSEKQVVTTGVTHHAEYFVIKTLAHDYGYRTVHEQVSAEVVSWVLAPIGRAYF